MRRGVRALSRYLHRLGDQLFQIVRADEQVPGKLALLQDLAIDGLALIEIELEAGQILQPQVPIAVDLGIP